MGNRYFDGELWTLDSLLVQKVGGKDECSEDIGLSIE
jgi:hypothetical protein